MDAPEAQGRAGDSDRQSGRRTNDRGVTIRLRRVLPRSRPAAQCSLEDIPRNDPSARPRLMNDCCERAIGCGPARRDSAFQPLRHRVELDSPDP